MSKRIIILGAGGYANTVSDVAGQLGYEILAMLDDKLQGFELDTFQSTLPQIRNLFLLSEIIIFVWIGLISYKMLEQHLQQ